MSALMALRLLSLSRFTHLALSHRAKSLWAEIYVVSWLGFLVLLLLRPHLIGAVPAIALTSYRLVDAMAFRLSVLFVDRYNPGWRVHSLNRTLLLLLLNYFELAVGFAVLYLVTGSIAFEAQAFAITLPGRAMYFSVVTLSTLGYGDIEPFTDVGRLLATLEVLAGFMLVVLVIGAFLTGLRDIGDLKLSSAHPTGERPTTHGDSGTGVRDD